MTAETQGTDMRPEQTFFTDPAVDRLYGMVWALATEVYVLRDRVGALEGALAAAGTVDLDTLRAEPSLEDQASARADRKAFVDALMVNLSGAQQAKGAPV